MTPHPQNAQLNYLAKATAPILVTAKSEAKYRPYLIRKQDPLGFDNHVAKQEQTRKHQSFTFAHKPLFRPARRKITHG